jgi:tRNA(Arg) A34 adenosine deaminase TadA
MCLSAIIWANIKTVYYGNAKEDAKQIGFRDDAIYMYIKKLLTGEKSSKGELELIPMDSKETIKTFELFKNKEDKTIY